MHFLRHYYRYLLYVLALTAWIWWDLTRAHNTKHEGHLSFLDARDETLKSPAATKVAIVRSNDPVLADPCPVTAETLTYQTVAQMVRRAVDLAGGLSGVVKSGDTVLIKPNLVQADSSGSGGVTDVRVVKALVYLIDEIDHGKIAIVVGDGSPRPFTTFEKASGTSQRAWKELFGVSGYQLLKTEALAAGINFRITNLNGNSDTDPWPELDTVTVPGGGSAQLQAGKYFLHRDVTHASVYISVPVMKIHKEPGFTCALKNQIGIAPSTRYGFNKTTGVLQENRVHKLHHLVQAPYNWQDKEIVDLSTLARIKFVVVDALACLETDKSPSYTSDSSNINIKNRVKMNTIIAGYDPVAVDHVCCRVMGLNPDDIEHITLAERVGLGTNNPDSITVLGSSIEQTKRLFKKPQTWSGLYGQSNRTWLLNGPYSTDGIANPMDSGFIANETSAAPVAGGGGWSQPVYFINDQIMLNDYYAAAGTSTSNVLSYAFTYILAPADRGAELWVGSDEALRIYLNGVVVYNYSGTRTFAGTENYKDTVTVILKKGRNPLLVKALQKYAAYNFSVNICDVESNALYRGNRVWGLKFATDPGTASGVPQVAGTTPESFSLSQNYPNPFNPSTTIGYTVPGIGSRHEAIGNRWVQLGVYDILGCEVATLVNEMRDPGTYTVTWNAIGMASGVYLYRLQVGDYIKTRKALLLK